MQRVLVLLFIMLVQNHFSYAVNTRQDSSVNVHNFSVRFYSGILKYHHKEMEIMQDKRASAVEFSFAMSGSGKKLWHSFYNYPTFGLSYKFMDLGNSSILGYSHSVYPFINLPILSHSNKLQIGLFVAPGMSYITKIYHRTDNFKNSAISSHFNAYINLGSKLSYKISKKLTIEAGAHLAHFSNGTFKKPNSGLNYTLFSLGFSYLNKSSKLYSDTLYSFPIEKNRILIAGVGSYKEVKGAGGPKYWVGSLSVEYSRPIETLWRYGFSWDLMYDDSNGFILDTERVPWNSTWETFKSGVTLNTELILDRLSAVFYFGGYIYNKNRPNNNGLMYQRIGLRYRISDYLWFHFALKTHWGSADYVEFGIAYKIL